MGVSLQRRLWLDRINLIVLDVLSILYCLYCIGLIVLAGLFGSYQLDRIGWIVSVLVLVFLGETDFYVLDETDGLDEVLVGREWYIGTGVSRRWNWSATIGS